MEISLSLCSLAYCFFPKGLDVFAGAQVSLLAKLISLGAFASACSSRDTNVGRAICSEGFALRWHGSGQGCDLAAGPMCFSGRWRREVRIKKGSHRWQGETWYYGPCGKRMKQFPEVIKVM